MKNTIRFIAKNFLRNLGIASGIVLFSLSGFLSCVSIPGSVVRTKYPRIDSSPPVDAFGFVMVQVTYSADKCLPSQNFESCELVIDKLPPITQSSIGSGLLVKAKSKTVFLTAAHVCSPEESVSYERDGIKIKMKSEVVIKIRTDKGELIDSKIEKEDQNSDLCALSLSKIYTKPVQWSRREPRMGEKVYALSAPMGINHPTMTLIFSGHYSGHIYSMHHYTIPTRPGSSGSVVLDRNFQGVGMLNAAYINMESIGIGAGFYSIRSFLDSI